VSLYHQKISHQGEDMTKRAFLCTALFHVLISLHAVAESSALCPEASISAVSLSGGGAKGGFEAGALFHLVIHRECDIRDFSGVSVGALNASYLAQAAGGTNSLENLKDHARRLVKLWQDIKGPQDILRPRFLAMPRLVLFGIESLNDFTPLRRLIDARIDPHLLQKNQEARQRWLRVGVASFYDGTYAEIEPVSPRLIRVQQFNEFVYASSLIPVYGRMPRIPGSQDDNNPDHWPQYADGGLRHTTPVPGYFPACRVHPLKLALAPATKDAGCLPPLEAIPPHPGGIQQLFLIVATPYRADSDRLPPPACCQDPSTPDKAESDGRRILERTLSVALNAPYRWDINYALIANHMLEWRASTIDRAKTSLDTSAYAKLTSLLARTFPVSSYNRQAGIDHPYRLSVIAPNKEFADTYGFDPVNIREQLRAGCEAANAALVKDFGVPSLLHACDADFPK
jgi:hypothetical protein